MTISKGQSNPNNRTAGNADWFCYQLLVKLLEEGESIRSSAASRALGQIGKLAVKDLVAVLKDKKAEKRARELAARALGDMGRDARSAVSALMIASKESGFLSIYAEAALKKINPHSSRKTERT